VWVILAYMIASTVLVLTAGRLSDLFGRKRAYLIGFALFAVASLGAGFSVSGTELILWRILQGVGGALLFANSSALVTDAFPRERAPSARPDARPHHLPQPAVLGGHRGRVHQRAVAFRAAVPLCLLLPGGAGRRSDHGRRQALAHGDRDARLVAARGDLGR